MKIDSSVKSVDSSGSSVKRTTQASTSANPVIGDKVEISTGLQQAEAALANTPVVNVDRVAEIKQAISQGKFQINPERIADGLLNSVKQMLAASR